ncbi:hypothetical protein SSX86_021653 [Deinandra increscens subsp. villosa]|uniref:Glycosyltransferase n=1 Tax=Deinandra increscens subsp. villosa TaxID=3103831 RepID=A0AAP0CTL0_9ASTR
MSNTLAAELIFIPAPGAGHITPTIEIAKLFVNRDQRLSVTLLIINLPGSSPASLITTDVESPSRMDRISFIELPQDETPTPTSESKNPLTSLNEFITSHCKHVRSIVADRISKQPGSSRIVGFVIDLFCTSMIDVANEFDIPSYVFFTSGAAFLGFKFHIQTLSDDQNQDIVQLSYSDTETPVPAFVKPVPTKVFPPVVQSKETLNHVLSTSRRLREVKAIMVNSFLELETHAIDSLSSDNTIPPVYSVGPLLNLEGGTSGGTGKPLEDDVMRWLDNQPPSSVVLLCFGSLGSFEAVQVKEIARALEHSGYRFVWSLRQASNKTTKFPRDYKDPRTVLPEGFLERTDGIGKVIGWAPQVELLAHRAVGGFVSHCGWNSLLESLWFGVPVAAWPMYAEQQLNAFEMVLELGLAVEIKLDYKNDLFNPAVKTIIVTADEIESGIRRVMEDNLVRRKVKVMSEKSRSTIIEGGSSYTCFSSLIQDVIRNVS